MVTGSTAKAPQGRSVGTDRASGGIFLPWASFGTRPGACVAEKSTAGRDRRYQAAQISQTHRGSLNDMLAKVHNDAC